MWWLRAKVLQVLWLFRSEKTGEEVDDEIRFHIEMRTRENVEAGLSPEDAERGAARRFGRRLEVQEEGREARRGSLVHDVVQDVRYGLRSMRKNPGFTTVALITLALGVGANAAIFSVVDAVLLRSLPYEDPDRLVMVWEDATDIGFPQNTPAPANYLDWKSSSESFVDMAATASSGFSLTGDGEPEQVVANRVTGNFFQLLGVKPQLGRTFRPDEDAPDAPKVAIISNGLWKSRYASDPSIVGRDILLSDEKYTVVGVMPSNFEFLESFVKVWVPMALDAEERANRGGHYLTVVGRLKPGVSADASRSEIAAIMKRIAADHPEAKAIGAYTLPIREQLAGDVRQPLVVLVCAVAFVLLTCCANIANLLLSRGTSRYKEIAVRAALGAGRARILRQLVTESLVLAGIGCVVGLALAYASLAFLENLIPESMRLSTTLAIDGRVLLFTIAVGLAAGVVFGVAPALRVSRVDLNEALQSAGRGRTGTGQAGRRLRDLLTIGEVGIAVVLLVGATLMIKTFYQLRVQYSGLNAAHLLTARTALPRSRYADHTKRVAFYDAVLERVTSIPGVTSAGYSTTVPLEWKGGTSGFWIEGSAPGPDAPMQDANHRQVTAEYLQTMGIALRRGRYFDERDSGTAMPVAIVNETMARAFFPGDGPIGRRLKPGDPDDDMPWFTVVGVVADVRQMGAEAPVKAEMYFPAAQATFQPWFAPRDLAVRTTGDPEAVASAVRDVIHAVDPNQPVANVRTMAAILGEETQTRETGTALLVSFAAVALLLAAVGIYGLLSYFVVQHTPEIGVRLSLGARPVDVIALVVRRGMRLVVVGAAIGIVGALALSRFVASLLFGVSPLDPLTFLAVPALLVGVALVACSVPARRAARVDPMVALRAE